MADISAKDVAALRKTTGAGMMDCKRALEESDGDMDAAKDWLRQKGLAGASKREGREANEGAIEVVVDGNRGALVELNCETDFVAKGDVFKRSVTGLTRLVLDRRRRRRREQDVRGRDRRRLREGHVRDARREDPARASGPVRDERRPPRRLQARAERARRRSASSSSSRVWTRRTRKAREVAHDIALHIASAAPRYVSRDDVPADAVTRERAVLEAQTREEGKPEQALGKIVDGKLNGFFKTVALLEQPFVKDQKTTIKALVDGLGGDASVRRFARVKIGEE